MIEKFIAAKKGVSPFSYSEPEWFDALRRACLGRDVYITPRLNDGGWTYHNFKYHSTRDLLTWPEGNAIIIK